MVQRLERRELFEHCTVAVNDAAKAAISSRYIEDKGRCVGFGGSRREVRSGEKYVAPEAALRALVVDGFARIAGDKERVDRSGSASDCGVIVSSIERRNQSFCAA